MKKFFILLTALIASGATVYAQLDNNKYSHVNDETIFSAYTQTERDESGDCRIPRVILKRKNGIAV
ncbi:MAG: hypothetical protein K2L42_01795 [Clostridia bacterium]|nr:hypothetical protein [Clostridia bacterium]